MKLVDTHAHLFWDSYKDDFDQVIDRCVKNSIETIVNVGTDLQTSKIAAQIESNKVKMYSSIAIHPEGAIRYFGNEQKIQQDIDELENIYRQNPNKVIAVGECGLDYSYFKRAGHLPENISLEQAKNLQRQLFQAHIDLAKKLNLPLLLHVRDDRAQNPDLIECWDEIFAMANDHYGVLHCYSGLMPTTKKALSSNYLISFAGNLTYKKNGYLREAVKYLPLEKILLETDCPFLAPQSIRGQRNEPSSVKEIAKTIAGLKGTTLDQVATQTTKNFDSLIKN